MCDSDGSDQERHEHISLVSCIYILIFTDTYNLLWSDTISDKFELNFQDLVHKINVKTWYFPHIFLVKIYPQVAGKQLMSCSF